MSGLVYYLRARVEVRINRVLIPFMSGLVYYMGDEDKYSDKECLNPLYVGSRLLPTTTTSLSSRRWVLIPFMSGLVYYFREGAIAEFLLS